MAVPGAERRDGRPGIVWFRRDLRLGDNPAWAAATVAHEEVVAAFVLEPTLLRDASPIRRDQLLAHLAALDARLRELGGCLVVRQAPASEAIPRLIEEADASAVYLNRDTSPWSRRRDAAVINATTAAVYRFDGTLVHEPGAVLTRKGSLSKVFTPFYRTWSATDRTAWPEQGSGRPLVLPGPPALEPAGPVREPPGEMAAWERVEAWLDRVDDYAGTRDHPAVEGTSGLSVDLKFGTLAARTLVDVVGDATPGREAFVRQLAWRDWWAHMLAERPDLADVPVRSEYSHIRWRDDPDGFEAWCTGRTGYPIIDAGMRQLTTTGWMHGRVRMLCASFLVKDLLIDWRRGERFFRHHLIDADPAQNAGNWQWVAGTGPDAAPYFRVLNPVSQSRRIDPDGEYIRRWVPELTALDASMIHEPSAAGADTLGRAAAVSYGTYPGPIVDHAHARVRALGAYRAARR